MNSVAEWFSAVREAVWVEPALGLARIPDAALSRAVALDGFPAVLPLWGGRRCTVGLLADPARGPDAWAGVIVQDGEALTIASDSRTLLPQYVLLRCLSNNPDGARRVADRWSDLESRALALHHALGGVPATLQVLGPVAASPDLRNGLMYRRDGEAEFEAAHSRLSRAIDRTEPFRRYADWLDGCIRGVWPTLDSTFDLGPWKRRARSWAQILSPAHPQLARAPASWLHERLEACSGIDAALPIEPSWSVQAGQASGRATLIEVAETAEHELAPTDPVHRALIKALVAEGDGYRGFAHAEAAVALDERGESERAWNALQSAAWWAARSIGQAPAPLLDSARFLAERHEWTDVLWMLDPV